MCLLAIPLAIIRAIFEAFVFTLQMLWMLVTTSIGAVLAFAFIALICWGIISVISAL
jgi:hypothetical protein